MNKDRYELKGKSFIDNKTNQCLNFGLKDLVRVTVTLNSMNRWLEQDKEAIADLEAKLAESEKDRLMWQEMYKNADRQNKEICETDIYPLQEENSKLKQQLAESENKLNQYPYKNDVIEKQYEELKNGIKFRIENNITADWEQLYHCIDVLCEKHKTRIRDIENGICSIEKLEQQLAEKDKAIENWETIYRSVMQSCHNGIEEDKRLEKLLAEKEKELHYKTAECEKWKTDYENCSKLEKIMSKEHQYCLDKWRASEQDKISFAVKQLSRARNRINSFRFDESKCLTKKDCIEDCLEALDKQIIQLKEMK